MSYEEILEEILPDDWEMVDSSVIICPCGYEIELDGQCPDGCVSPLRTMGMI